jgi:hypothetical protein
MITQETKYYVWQQHRRFTWSNIFSDSGCSFQDISFSCFGTSPCGSQFTQEYPDNRGAGLNLTCIQMIRILSMCVPDYYYTIGFFSMIHQMSKYICPMINTCILLWFGANHKVDLMHIGVCFTYIFT